MSRGQILQNLFDALVYGVQDFHLTYNVPFLYLDGNIAPLELENKLWLYGFKTQLKNNEVQ